MANIFNIPYNSVASEMIDLVVKRVENNDYHRKVMMSGSAAPAPKVATKQYTTDKIEEPNLDRDPVTNKYKNPTTKKQYGSVTGTAIPEMQSKQYAEDGLSYGERKAGKLWGNEDRGVKKKIRDIDHMVTFAEAAAHFEMRKDLGIAKGQIFHKLIHYHFTKDAKIRSEIDSLMVKYDISDGEIEWMGEQTILKVILRTGSDFVRPSFEDGELKVNLNPKSTDRVKTEMTISSDILNLAGTVDLVIDHGDNVLSYYDVKTGAAFDRVFENDIFQFGDVPGEDSIFVNNRNKAKLQLMWYAMITKVKHPDTKFRNLELIHIPNFMYVDKPDMRSRINVRDYLFMIKNYLKERKPEVYKELQALPHFDAIFDPTTYNYVDSEVVDIKPGSHDIAKELQLKILKLQSLILWDRNIEDGIIKGQKKSRKTYEQIQKLMGEIIKMKGEPGVDYSSWTSDMS